MPSISELNVRRDISEALKDDQKLAEDVASSIAVHPETASVFQRVIQYLAPRGDLEGQRHHKRVKLEHEHNDTVKDNGLSGNLDHSPEPKSDCGPSEDIRIVLTVNELSFVTPVRKKLSLVISQSSLVAYRPSDSSKAELEVPLHDISNIAVLPVPDKAAKMFNFCIFKKSSDDAIVFTVPESPPKLATGEGIPTDDDSVVSSYKTLISHTLNKTVKHLRVMEPNTQDFVSALPQPHRKTEPAVHVTAHRGSKEGYLYFLGNGFVYGFKRPLLFIALDDVVSVIYNDILQRTFNLTITTRKKEENLEFSMIDIAEHDRVDKYVRKYRLNDASLSESRKAKIINGKNVAAESEIVRAANEIAASVTGQFKEESEGDEEGDEDFCDDESHSGSTLASDETDVEASGEEGDEDATHDDDDDEEGDNDGDDEQA